ncbi:MAG TPA: NYN domain-containing protein [Acidimicrobiales bacterium]|nr:NYN domain-containing protein [Acidimicrobiales bacterium]
MTAERDALLRSLAELTLEVVRARRAEVPPVPPPRPLLPLLRFAKLPPRAIASVIDALDKNDDLRAAVASSPEATKQRLGEAGDLFVRRPDRWAERVEELVGEAEAARAEGAQAAGERVAQRRLVAIEEEAATLADALARTRNDVSRLTVELAEMRSARTAAESALQEAERSIERLERERDAAHRRVAAADAEARRLRSELELLRATIAERSTEAARVEVARMTPELRSALADAEVAANNLRDALGRAEAAVPPAAADPPPVAPSPEGRGGRRRPLPVPNGLFEDSPETAEAWIRAPHAVVLVDGYNATLRAWPDAPLEMQRARLADAAGELAARVGAEVVIVFDGAGRDASAEPLPMRTNVRVRFTAADVEADDVLLEMIDVTPPARPVLVASDDQRVRVGATARGANVISQAQLFGLLRRERP